jgi:hypothetical protein
MNVISMDDTEILLRKLEKSKDQALSYLLKLLITLACLYAAFIFGRDLLLVLFRIVGIAGDIFIFAAIGILFLYVAYRILKYVLTPRKTDEE